MDWRTGSDQAGRAAGPWTLRKQTSEPSAGRPTRQCLEQRFSHSAAALPTRSGEPRQGRRLFGVRLPAPPRLQTQQVLRMGQRTLHEVASSIDLLSQRLRRSTRRRYRLTDSPLTPSPGVAAGGRRGVASPAAEPLYSPFGIETPVGGGGRENAALEVTPTAPPRRRRALQNVTNVARRVSPRRKQRAPQPPHCGVSPRQLRALGPPPGRFHSPTGRLRLDAARAERTGRELQQLAQRVTEQRRQ